MIISSERIGKKFNNYWIFKDLSFSLRPDTSCSITGPNGSGKSTLLKIISGFTLPSSGKVNYLVDGQTIPDEQVYKYVTYTAPYIEVIEEFTLIEFLEFHFKFKNYQGVNTHQDLILNSKLEGAENKWIKNFSSGMKQRLKLALSFFSDSPVLLFDEPTTNLDDQGKDWYLEQINNVKAKKLIIIASNQSYEHDFCDDNIHLPNFK